MKQSSIDVALLEIGFKKYYESDIITGYTRYDKQYDFHQNVDLGHKASGAHILQSYDRATNECVGLAFYELMLFQMKMEELGLVCGKLAVLNHMGEEVPNAEYDQLKRVATKGHAILCEFAGEADESPWDACKKCPYGDVPTTSPHDILGYYSLGCYEAYMNDVFSACGLKFKE